MPLSERVSAKVRVVHEIPGRLRLRYPRAADPAVDQDYLRAILLAAPGVKEVTVNPRTASIVLVHDNRDGVKEECLSLLRRLPRDAFLSHAREYNDVDKANLISMGCLTLLAPILPRPVGATLSWLAAAPTILAGVETMINRGLKVEILDGFAVGASLLRRDYFTSNAIVTLLALGRYLEQVSDYKSTELLKSLLRPEAGEVWVEKDGLELAAAAEDLKIGDLVICGAGEMIPIDGRVVRGEASINKSSITGESIPDSVAPDDMVTSGSVVEEGRIVIKALNVGQATTMARMYRYLERSLRTQSEPELRLARLADKLVPVSLGAAAAELILFRRLDRAVSVLTVDYSCVLKLVSPVVVKTTMYNAGRRGVIIKGAQALESFAQADAFVFDKTGTLTTGALEVNQVIPLQEMTEDQLLALAAGAEEHYSHPVGQAVVKAARLRGLTPPSLSQVDFVVAHGVSAFVDDQRVLVGSHHFVAEDEGIDCSAAEDLAGRLRADGKSILYVAHEQHLEGIITLKDQIRPEAVAVMERLKADGVEELIVLTGDHQDSARKLAADLPVIDQVHWELKPEEKSRIVNDLKKQGRRVVFVGDGVNDAPALINADVGVCMPAGADLARESAQVILLHDDLEGLASARRIALASQRVLQNSFYGAVGLNSAVLGLAGLGLISPLASAVMHNAATIGVLAYAARTGSSVALDDGPDK